MINGKDIEILSIIQRNARTSNAEIARRVGMAASGVHERIRKLEAAGIVTGYETRVDPMPLNLGMLAFVFVRADERVGGQKVGERLAKIPEVLEVHHVAGEDCYLAKVRAAGTADLARILRERVAAIKEVRATRTTIVLDTVKETACLPLPNPPTQEP